MNPRVLLVTGSRTLAGRKDASAAKEWISSVLVRTILAHGITVIVCGDACGPDTWAHAIGISQGRRVAQYEAQSGLIVMQDGETYEHTVTPWTKELDRIAPTERPLRRNEVMVLHTAKRDPHALVLGFVDPSPTRTTRGTEHTMQRASRCGLNVHAYLWGLSNMEVVRSSKKAVAW